jgi:cytidine deaminase
VEPVEYWPVYFGHYAEFRSEGRCWCAERDLVTQRASIGVEGIRYMGVVEF